MSRLDSVIRRLTAQRDCLGWAVHHAPAGPCLDIGLGNGRTYHHLREIAPGRDLWTIDRAMKAHPSSIPPPEFYLEGEAVEMIGVLAERIGRGLALVHYDLGIGVPEQDRPLADAVGAVLTQVLAPGALIVTNAKFADYPELPLPEGVPEGRYFIQCAED